MISPKAIIKTSVVLLLPAVVSCSTLPVNSNAKSLFVQTVTLTDREPEAAFGAFDVSDRRAKRLVNAMNGCSEMNSFLKMFARYRVVVHYEDGTDRVFQIRGKRFQAVVNGDLVPYECQEDLEQLITSLFEAVPPDRPTLHL